jgi:hypothetical protein
MNGRPAGHVANVLRITRGCGPAEAAAVGYMRLLGGTTRKARWVAASLDVRPIPGTVREAPASVTAAQIDNLRPRDA